jgi:glucose/arabinose dehydrogenase
MRWAALLVAVAATVAPGCDSGLDRDSAPSRAPSSTSVLVDNANFPAAMAALENGGLLYGERLSGRIRAVDSEGNLRTRPVAGVEVSTNGQRGLLGLAVDRRGRVFAAWSRPDKRLVVGQVSPGPMRLVWVGPESSDLANGGHLALAPDGRLVIGIGDLREPELVSDPGVPNGKLLALDPKGPATQEPAILSSGWNNPYAFTFTPAGDLWVADNSPGTQPERLARGDVRAPAITKLAQPTAPSGLAAVSNTRLLMCGYITRTLQAYVLTPDARAIVESNPLATDCSLAVVVLADGRVAYSNEDAIRVLAQR